MRKLSLSGALLLSLVLFGAIHAEGAEPVKARRPWAIVAITRCDHYETLYITFDDGGFTTIDVSKSDPEEVNNYVLSAPKYGELKMDCTAVGHDSVR